MRHYCATGNDTARGNHREQYLALRCTCSSRNESGAVFQIALQSKQAAFRHALGTQYGLESEKGFLWT